MVGLDLQSRLTIGKVQLRCAAFWSSLSGSGGARDSCLPGQVVRRTEARARER